MNNCLVICPTYNRPAQLAEMVKSFYATSTCSDLILLTERGSITELINSVNYDKYDFVSVTNDDFVYHTQGWDRMLIERIENKGYGIAFGNDGTNNKHLPSTCVISRNIVRPLGWIQYPKLDHLCGDVVWQYIGKAMNCLFYVQEVKIEHKHFLFGKSEKRFYERTNSREMYAKDNSVLREWVRKDSNEDIKRIKDFLGV